MAHTKSARKRIRQGQKRHLRNQSVKTRIKSLTKKFRTAVAEAKPEQVQSTLREISRALDKAATRGVVHRRSASRRTARLARAAYRISAAPSDKAAAP